MKLTEKRRAYLERLLDGPKPRDGSMGNVGFACMQAGWTEWDHRVNGQPVEEAEYWQRIREGKPVDRPAERPERITEAGRTALKEQEQGR